MRREAHHAGINLSVRELLTWFSFIVCVWLLTSVSEASILA